MMEVASDQKATRFPPPWRILERGGCFMVQDATGYGMGWFYYRDDRDDPTTAPSAAARFRKEALERAVKYAGPMLDKAAESPRRGAGLLKNRVPAPSK
jgi:hypothetical protein